MKHFHDKQSVLHIEINKLVQFLKQTGANFVTGDQTCPRPLANNVDHSASYSSGYTDLAAKQANFGGN